MSKTYDIDRELHRLDSRELGTVLVGLRCLQQRFGQPYLCGGFTEAERVAAVKEQFEHFYDVEPLNPSEIDALCERLNCGSMDPDDSFELSEKYAVTMSSEEYGDERFLYGTEAEALAAVERLKARAAALHDGADRQYTIAVLVSESDDE